MAKMSLGSVQLDCSRVNDMVVVIAVDASKYALCNFYMLQTSHFTLPANDVCVYFTIVTVLYTLLHKAFPLHDFKG